MLRVGLEGSLNWMQPATKPSKLKISLLKKKIVQLLQRNGHVSMLLLQISFYVARMNLLTKTWMKYLIGEFCFPENI